MIVPLSFFIFIFDICSEVVNINYNASSTFFSRASPPFLTISLNTYGYYLVKLIKSINYILLIGSISIKNLWDLRLYKEILYL